MFIKVVNNKVEKYTIEQLRKDNLNTSFPVDIPEDTLAEYGVFPLFESPEPINNPSYKVVEDVPINVLGFWYQTWKQVELSAEEKLSIQQEQDYIKRLAYQHEADPLFFKWQRGEATKEEWLAKVEEIRNRG